MKSGLETLAFPSDGATTIHVPRGGDGRRTNAIATVPTLQDRIDRLQAATADGTELEQAMLREPIRIVERHTTAHPGQSRTYFVVFDSWDQAIHKPFAGQSVPSCGVYRQDRYEAPVHEVVAWRLARALGGRWEQMVPTAVLRDVPKGEGGGVLIDWRDGWGDPAAFADVTGLAYAAAFWDALIGQQDRHMNNFRYLARSRRLALIDNAFSFARPGDPINASLFLAYRRSHGATQLAQRELEALSGLLESADLHGLSGFLPPDRLDALEVRAHKMLHTRMLPLPGAF